MTVTNQARIIIHRPTDWVGRSWRSFIVRIDGRRVGRVKPGAAGEFAVEPGSRTVAVSMDWVRSRAVQLVVEPESKTELAIRGQAEKMVWWMNLLPIVITVWVAEVLTNLILTATDNTDTSWWLRTGLFFLVYLLVYAAFVVVTANFGGRYWERFTLEPLAPASPGNFGPERSVGQQAREPGAG